MRLQTILVLMVCIGGVITKSVKKSTGNAAARTKSEATINESLEDVEIKKVKTPKLKPHNAKKVSPAIIAIEIVDPNDNGTKSRNAKRTIESALGYGIPAGNSFGVTDKPKLVFYKYSQRDIPPYQPQQNDLQIQKAVRYDLGTTRHVEYSPKPVAQHYQPTTLFATFNQQGQVGGFTQNIPQHGHNVPVILLRVYTNQLGGAVYPNLPVTHPYAGLNNINLQSMFNTFFDKHFGQQNGGGQHELGQYQLGQQQVGQQQLGQQQIGQPELGQHQLAQHQGSQHQVGLPQLQLHQIAQHQGILHQVGQHQEGHDQEDHQQGGQSTSYQQSNYPVQQTHYPEQQVGHQQQNYHQQQSYQQQPQYQAYTQQLYSQSQGQNQDYYLNQPNQYHQQYQDDIQQQQYNQQTYNYDNLPTHENYPSDHHTKVVFHPEKVNGKGDLQQPRVLPSKINTYQQPQSYSSLEFYSSPQTGSQNYKEYPQYSTQQDSTLKQNQDQKGFYYYGDGLQKKLQHYQALLDEYENKGFLSQRAQGLTSENDHQTQEDYHNHQSNYPSQIYPNQRDYGDQQDYQDQQNYATQGDYESPGYDLKSSAQESSGTSNERGQINTQTVAKPYNYHAHPTISKSNQKRMVRPSSSIRVNTPKTKRIITIPSK